MILIHICILLACLAENEGKHFAILYHRAVKGMGTDENAIARLTVTLSERNLGDVKNEYVNLFGSGLTKRIKVSY